MPFLLTGEYIKAFNRGITWFLLSFEAYENGDEIVLGRMVRKSIDKIRQRLYTKIYNITNLFEGVKFGYPVKVLSGIRKAEFDEAVSTVVA